MGDGAERGGRANAWAAAFGRLIRAGHRLADIEGYTLAQIRLFLEDAARHEAQQMQAHVTMTRLAVWGDQEAIKTAFKALRE